MNHHNFIKRWPYSCLLFFIISCNNSGKYESIRYSDEDLLQHSQKINNIHAALIICKQMIKPGDIITRTGNDFTSQSLRTLNRRDKTFSHCGIASIEHDSLFIYHALGGEWNPDQRLKRESYESFTDPEENTATGVFRFTIAGKMKERLITKAQKFYADKLKFDLAFDLQTDDKMYCAEFIYKTFLAATDSTVIFRHSFIGDFEFVGVDDITLDPRSEKITALNYRNINIFEAKTKH